MKQPTSIHRRPPQMSIGFMMLMMIIFAVMSAGLFYASRVPAIQEEIDMMMGRERSGGEDAGRVAHIAFIMFTFTSPLLLAGALSTGMAILRWYDRRR